jgi:hypothetical protein
VRHADQVRREPAMTAPKTGAPRQALGTPQPILPGPGTKIARECDGGSRPDKTDVFGGRHEDRPAASNRGKTDCSA